MDTEQFNNMSSYGIVSNITNGTGDPDLIAKPSKTVENAVLFFNTTGNIFGISSVLLNCLFVITVHFIKDRGSAYYHYIQNLAVADIFAAITFFVNEHYPHWSHVIIDPEENFFLGHGLGYLCRSLPWLFFTAYLLTLCCLTFNQFVAVCKPLRYSNVVTPKAVKLTLVAIWCISSLQLLIPIITFSSLSTMDNKAQAYRLLFNSAYIEIHIWMSFFVCTIFLNMTLNLVTYCKIKKLKRSQKTSGNREDRLTIASKHEAVITLILLLFASSLCRLPFPVMGIV